MAQASNPYETPKAAVAEAAGETQAVKLFSISGRIGRARYIAYGIGLYLLLSLIGGILAAVLGTAGIVAVVLAWLAILVLGFMLTIQRCHDFNTSGWLSILMLVPLVNLIFWFIPGTDGPNRYGQPTPPNSTLVIVGVCVVPLMVVFVGILAAVAIPAYSDYTVRAKMSEVILAASECRTSITDIYQSGRSAPGANNWGCEKATSKYVGGIATSIDGKVTVTTAGGLPAGVLTLAPLKAANTPALAADLSRGPVALHGWRCGNAAIDGTTVSPKYLPGACRGQ